METQLSINFAKKRTKHKAQVRENVITLVTYLDRVIHDIKYVVGDLQVLLEQIDRVSRLLDQSKQPRARSKGKLGNRETHNRCFCSQSPESVKLAKPLLKAAKGLRTGTKLAERLSRYRRSIEDDSSSVSSLDSLDSTCRRHKSNVMEFDTVSVELNAMWDNAFDKELIHTDWNDQKDESYECLVGNSDILFNAKGDKKQVLLERSTWFTGKLEQSLTSGIEMLSFTDDSEEEYLSSALSNNGTNCDDVDKKIVLSIDPYHVCCKEVIPLGSGRVYCGVYEAILDASLEPYSSMAQSESFGSDVQLFWGEPDIDEMSAVQYEPTYNTQLNTWTAFTMVALDSLHTSEEELSEAALDILNDNVPSTTLIDNINTFNGNKDVMHTEGQIRHSNTTATEGLETFTNRYIISG